MINIAKNFDISLNLTLREIRHGTINLAANGTSKFKFKKSDHGFTNLARHPTFQMKFVRMYFTKGYT